MLLHSTEQQKTNYQSKINDVLNYYDQFIKEVNKDLTGYAREFYLFSQGKNTLEYIKQAKEGVQADIINIGQKAFISMINYLEALNEEYIKECFPVENTTDPVELNFIKEELSLMELEELREFFNLNFLNKNKMRVFDLEVKKRKKEGIIVYELEELKDQCGVKDEVTEEIEGKIKLFNAYRQILSGSFAMLKISTESKLNLLPQVLSYTELFDFVEGKSNKYLPGPINVIELLTPGNF